MPDLTIFSIVRSGNVQLTVPTWLISGQIVSSKNGNLLQDFTGGNAVSFPQILGQLTQAEQDEMVDYVVNWLLRKRFPGAFT